MYVILGVCFIAGILTTCLYNCIMKRTLKRTASISAENEKRMFQLVEKSKDIIYWYDLKPKQKLRYVSPSVEKLLGHGWINESEKSFSICFDKIHPDDREQLFKKIKGEIDYNKPIIQRWKNQQGDYLWFEEYTTPIYANGQLVAIQGIVRNVDEKVKLQKNLEYRLTHDYVTEIYNRTFFENQLQKYNEHMDKPFAMILCDLDELKFVNDHFGHRKGDFLIKEAASLLKKHSSDNVIVSRIGGDEFAVIIIGTTFSYAENLFRQISGDIERYNANNPEIIVEMSKGFAYNPSSLRNLEDLFAEADRKMYKEKRLKKVLCTV